MSRKNRRECPIAALCSVLGTLLLIVVIILCVPLTVPRALGYIPYTVVSGSMEPAISTGSLVYVRYVEPETILADEVIAYYGGRDQDAVVTHRVVENQISRREFITKGDANAENDMLPVSYHYLLGRREAKIPVLGSVAQILTVREGKFVVLGIIGFAVVLHLIAAIINRQR